MIIPSETLIRKWRDCAVGLAGDADSGANNGTTWVQGIAAAQLLENGSKIRVTFTGPASSEDAAIQNVYVGPKAASGNAYDAAALTQIFKSSNGASSATIALGATDTFESMYPIDVSKDLLITWEFNGGTAHDTIRQRAAGDMTGWTIYFNAGGLESSSAVKTAGYSSAASRWFGVSKVEMFR